MHSQKNYSLLPHNTFGMDVKAKSFLQYDSAADLQSFIREGSLTPPFLHIGCGSNLLFTKDYDGVILHSGIHGIEIVHSDPRQVTLRVGAAEIWDNLVEYAVDQGWYGVENLSLIPGEVGAAAVQNIGAYGVEAKDVITQVECVDLHTGQQHILSNADCRYGYRQSVFKRELNGKYAVTHVSLRLHRTRVLHLDYGNIRKALPPSQSEYTARDVRKAIIDIRNQKLPDPKILGNAGSFFMNPVVSAQKFTTLQELYPDMPHYDATHGVKIPAGWLIEQCGLKGYVQGNVGVYEKQALVLVNKGGATPQEVVAMSEKVRTMVKDKFDIDIQPEVIFV